jgi:hypothetical protein
MSDQEPVRTLAGAKHIVPVEESATDTEIERLRAELAEERARRIFAEAIAEERAQALEDARLALRAVAALQATNEPEPEPEPELAPGDEPRPRPKGNWLR